MEHLVNPQVKSIAISGIRRFFQLASQVEDVVSLTIGQPDFPTPEHVKEAAKRAIDDNFTVYTANAGMPELRKAAADFVKEKYHLSYDPEKEVIVTVGATEAIDIAFRTLLSPGDEVLLPAPVYPGYEPLIRLCGARPVFIDTRPFRFKLTAEALERHLTGRTKCLVLSYPANPTGVSYSPEELAAIARVIRGKNMFILADEIYSEIVYGGPHVSIGEILREQTVVINGLSKSHSMTGFRIGFLFAPEDLAKQMLKVHQYNVSCASSVSQRAAVEALTKGKDDPARMREEYKKRRDYVYKRLKEAGFETVLPDGAFYFFVKIPGNANSFDFCLNLVREHKVAVVPGSAFSPFGEGYFRLSYASSMDVLKEGLDRLAGAR